MLWIRIRIWSDPKLLEGSGSGINNHSGSGQLRIWNEFNTAKNSASHHFVTFVFKSLWCYWSKTYWTISNMSHMTHTFLCVWKFILKRSVADPGCLSRILDPIFFDSGSSSKNLFCFNPKTLFLSTEKYNPGFSSQIRIPDPDPDFLPIPDPDPQHS